MQLRGDSPEALMWDIMWNAVQYTPLPGHRVLDLGAHHAYFSLYCAARGATVKAYEPLKENYDHAVETLNRGGCRGSVELINKAVWPQPTIRIWKNPDNTGASTTGEVGDLVECDTLHQALGGQVWDCVKVDIEGAERVIFRDLPKEDFSLIRYLTMEMHLHAMTREEENDLISTLRQGFSKVNAVIEEINPENVGRCRVVFCSQEK
jgi:FkbM family methyltransferase